MPYSSPSSLQFRYINWFNESILLTSYNRGSAFAIDNYLPKIMRDLDNYTGLNGGKLALENGTYPVRDLFKNSVSSCIEEVHIDESA